MTQPLAILNDEEVHWLSDLGLPNQRRWLNHRTLGDEHRRTFPSAAKDSNTTLIIRSIRVPCERWVNDSYEEKKNTDLINRATVFRRRLVRVRGWCGL